MTVARRSPDAPGPLEWARYLLFEYIPLWFWVLLVVAWSSVIIVAVLAFLNK